MKTPIEIHVAGVRDMMLMTIIFAFVVAALVAATIAADRHYAEKCRIEQEVRPCQ